MRPGQQWISEMHVDLGHEKRRQKLYQLRGYFAQLHHHHFANTVSNIVFFKQILGAARVARNDPRDS